jgi:hypothetical protein
VVPTISRGFFSSKAAFRQSHPIRAAGLASQWLPKRDHVSVRNDNIEVKHAEAISKSPARARAAATTPRLFVLELNAGCIHSMNTDGSDRRTIVTVCRHPDGIVVDVEAGHIYWTNMGVPNLNDGSIERAVIDGRNRKTIVPEGATFTPKQIIPRQERRQTLWPAPLLPSSHKSGPFSVCPSVGVPATGRDAEAPYTAAVRPVADRDDASGCCIECAACQFVANSFGVR